MLSSVNAGNYAEPNVQLCVRIDEEVYGHFCLLSVDGLVSVLDNTNVCVGVWQ